MSECPRCGFPVDYDRDDRCPKCESDLRAPGSLGILEVDVCHAGETWEEASRKITAAIDRGVYWGHKGVKIVHGHGSSTGRAVIAPRAMALMRHLAEVTGGRFARDRQNPGASIVWLNR